MKTILIVDDEEDILIALKSYLTRLGYDVATSLTCQQGIEKFYLVKPDLVFLDVNVGNSDGRIMCRTIKSQAQYNNIPVILISANPLMLLKFAEYGAIAVLDKPFDLPNLITIVRSHLNN